MKKYTIILIILAFCLSLIPTFFAQSLSSSKTKNKGLNHLNKSFFVGTQKKIPSNGGAFLGEYLTIELLNDDNINIKEKKGNHEESEFRNVRFSDGRISGIYYFVIDNEHTINFVIKRIDEKTIVYKDNNTEEKFTRFAETDPFSGKWTGNRMKFTITKQNDKYKIKIVNEGIKGSPTNNLICSLKDGKLIYPGNEQQYYKFQIPTIELLPNGCLNYRDGDGDIELTKVK